MPKKKHIPERTCIMCRKKIPKKDLIRFCFKNGEIILDESKKEMGRGAYLCEECFLRIENKKVKRKLLYALRINL